jgi:peptidyl-prolyl cis-trans isomerase A (cyclophilin A)
MPASATRKEQRMKHVFFRHLVTTLASVVLVACQQTSPPAAQSANEVSAQALPGRDGPPAIRVAPLSPLPNVTALIPALTQKTTVRMHTTAGEVVIEVYPQAAPHAAQRFVELVKSGFYDDTPISRVVPNFVAQFGVNWRAPHKDWKDRTFDDDPTLFSLERGTLAFAKAGPNTNSTQVFINYKENNQLAEPRYNFTVFGKVVSGMDVVDRFARVGDPSGGLDQNRLWADGGAYLDSLPVKPTMIESATVD